MEANEFNNIIYDKDDQTGIVLVSINRPEIKNALSILHPCFIGIIPGRGII